MLYGKMQRKLDGKNNCEESSWVGSNDIPIIQ